MYCNLLCIFLREESLKNLSFVMIVKFSQIVIDLEKEESFDKSIVMILNILF